MNEAIAPFVLYHKNCFDGSMAAAIFLLHHSDAELHAYEYNDELPANETYAGRDVYLLDMTLGDEDLFQITRLAEQVVVIDHHPMAREQEPRAVKIAPNLTIFTDSDEDPRSGAQLTWEWLSGGAEEPDVVRWVGKRDLWIFDEPEIRPFSLAVSQLGFEPQTWKIEMFVVPNGPHKLLDEGYALEGFLDSQLEYLVNNCQVRLKIDDYSVIGVNAPKFLASEIGQRLYEIHSVEDSPFIAVYYEEGNQRIYSLRSHRDSPIHLGELCAKFGGGGHRHAAGFKVKIGRAPLDPK